MSMRYTHEQLVEWLKVHGTIRGGADPNFDQLSATTLANMARDVVQDNFFVDGAWQRIIRFYAQSDVFEGGLFMQEPFQYGRVNGGAYLPGSDVTVTQNNILSAMGFPPRAYKEDVPLNLWVTEVMNAGPFALVSQYAAYLENAVQSFNTDVNIDWYQHGQAASGTVLQNRIQFMDGADEALNNGTDPGFLGNAYPTYGGTLRNGVVSNTINSGVTWAGDQQGNPGQLALGVLFGAYLNCVQPPDTGLCNKAAFQYIWQRVQPQQNFVEQAGSAKSENDARIGMTGFKMGDAYIHVDKLAPSTKYGTLLPPGLSQTTPGPLSAFTTPSNCTPLSGYPQSTSCKPGEPFFWLRLQDWKVRPVKSGEYSGFTPMIRTQTNPDLIVQFYKAGINSYTPSPRDNWEIVGFGY